MASVLTLVKWEEWEYRVTFSHTQEGDGNRWLLLGKEESRNLEFSPMARLGLPSKALSLLFCSILLGQFGTQGVELPMVGGGKCHVPPPWWLCCPVASQDLEARLISACPESAGWGGQALKRTLLGHFGLGLRKEELVVLSSKNAVMLCLYLCVCLKSFDHPDNKLLCSVFCKCELCCNCQRNVNANLDTA